MSMNESKTQVAAYNITALGFAIAMIFPVAWIFMSSFKGPSELFTYPLTILPKNFTLDNYRLVMQEGDFILYFRNTAFVAVMSTLVTITINTMAGYAFAKLEFKGRDPLFIAFLSASMVPTLLIMNPTFSVISRIGLYNSFWGIIIPPAATPTGIFLMRQFFLTVPDSLLESARIEGASEWHIFRKIMLPLAKPAISILVIFSMMWRWNDFIWPLIVLNDPKKYTIQLALSNLAGEFRIDWNTLLASSIVSMIPLLIVFLIFQKYIMNGMVTSGMKD